jgi:hypothetical protein
MVTDVNEIVRYRIFSGIQYCFQGVNGALYKLYINLIHSRRAETVKCGHDPRRTLT